MKYVKIVKLLFWFCLLAILFSFDKFFVKAMEPRVPVTFVNPRDLEGDLVMVKPGDRVVGGKPAYHGEFPYQVSIQKIGFFGGKSHYCGGAIISEYCIVTAAHCLDGRPLDGIVVRLGSNSLRQDPLAKEVAVGQTILHPKYDSASIRNDIGIIKLRHKLEFKLNINKVQIVKDHVPVDTRCIVSGWGSTRESTPTVKTLMFADVPVWSDESCRNSYGKKEIKDSMMCAGYTDGSIDSCQGDSGGPLLCDGRLAGIVSWGIGCARAKFPGVYTELSHFRKWIESQDCSKGATPAKEPTLGSIFAGIFGLRSSLRNETVTLSRNDTKIT